MFRIFGVLILLMTSLVVGAAELPSPSSMEQKENSIVAIVNDSVILQSELDLQLKQAALQAQAAQMQLPDQSKLKAQILKQLIYKKLQLQMASKAGISVTDEEVADAIANIAKRKKVTLSQLKAQMSSQGLSFDNFKSEIKDQIIISKLQHQAVGQDVQVSNQDIAKASKVLKAHQASRVKYKAVAVLVPLPSSPTKAQQQQAESIAKTIQQQLKAGVATDTLQGGEATELGWRTAQQLPSIFADKLTTMTVGQVSSPFSAPNGLHVLMLLDKKGNQVNVTAQQARDLAYEQQYNKALLDWLKKIYKQSYIQIVSDQ